MAQAEEVDPAFRADDAIRFFGRFDSSRRKVMA